MMFAKRFQHLGAIERRRIVMPSGVKMRLNRLERPEPWPEELLQAIGNSASLDTLHQYPAYPAFYERLAAFVGVKPDEVVVGAGIEEHIRNLFMLCVEPGDKVAFLWPTCAMFEVYARAFGAEVVRIVTYPDHALQVDDVVNELPHDLKLLILVNPGQPVETCFGYAAIREIAEVCERVGAVCAIDEAYHGCGAPTMIGVARDHENMVVLRTFSKAFGAASIRLGYAVGGPKIIGAMNAVRQSGEVSAFSMRVATLLMDRFETDIRPGIEAICEGRNRLRERVIGELGLKAWGQWANHVLIEFPDRGVKHVTMLTLWDQGILTKADFPAPLDDHMLVTAGAPALMDAFFDELRAAL
jgi:histidinol-phosphate/aromatic aminotransferase/cobyric acid decarboxylase-like protein